MRELIDLFLVSSDQVRLAEIDLLIAIVGMITVSLKIILSIVTARGGK